MPFAAINLSNGHAIFAPDYSNKEELKAEAQLGCICPSCGEELCLRQGSKQLHFYHKNGVDSCTGKSESPQHERLKCWVHNKMMHVVATHFKRQDFLIKKELTQGKKSDNSLIRSDIGIILNDKPVGSGEVQLQRITVNELLTRGNRAYLNGIKSLWLAEEGSVIPSGKANVYGSSTSAAIELINAHGAFYTIQAVFESKAVQDDSLAYGNKYFEEVFKDVRIVRTTQEEISGTKALKRHELNDDDIAIFLESLITGKFFPCHNKECTLLSDKKKPQKRANENAFRLQDANDFSSYSLLFQEAYSVGGIFLGIIEDADLREVAIRTKIGTFVIYKKEEIKIRFVAHIEKPITKSARIAGFSSLEQFWIELETVQNRKQFTDLLRKVEQKDRSIVNDFIRNSLLRAKSLATLMRRIIG